MSHHCTCIWLNTPDCPHRMREERRKANFDRRPGRRGIRASEKVEEVDDISSWVTKSRQIDEKKKAEDKERAARMAKALEDQVSYGPRWCQC